MGRRSLVIPPWLRFACAGCGLCCRRGWLIHASSEDRERLAAVDWPGRHPELAGAALFAPHGGAWRLAVGADGACPFLDARNRCRIHADLGPEAKVAACRLYPLTFVSVGGETRVGAHFSCPAVADNSGPLLRDQEGELRRLLALVDARPSPGGAEAEAAPFDGRRRLSWDALARLEAALDEALRPDEVPLLRRALKAGELLDAVDESLVGPENGALDLAGMEELLRPAERRAHDVAVHGGLRRAPLRLTERLLLRLMAGLASEMAVPGLLAPSFAARQRTRWRRLRMALRFLAGRGAVAVAGRTGRLGAWTRPKAYPLPAPAEELLARYLRTRLATRAYFGREGWGLGVLRGARLLVSLHAVCVWLARLHAAARGPGEAGEGATVSRDDVRTAVMLVDHTFGHMAGLQMEPVRTLLGAVNRPGWPQKAALHACL